MAQRMYCGQSDHPGDDATAERWCQDYHRVTLPRIPSPSIGECMCVHTCADDPATSCSLSGEFHTHPGEGWSFGGGSYTVTSG